MSRREVEEDERRNWRRGKVGWISDGPLGGVRGRFWGGRRDRIGTAAAPKWAQQARHGAGGLPADARCEWPAGAGQEGGSGQQLAGDGRRGQTTGRGLRCAGAGPAVRTQELPAARSGTRLGAVVPPRACCPPPLLSLPSAARSERHPPQRCDRRLALRPC